MNKTLREAIKDIRDKADYYYCNGAELSKRSECLGWEAKVKTGEYGRAEHDSHAAVNSAFGKQEGLRLAANILEDLEGYSKTCYEHMPQKETK